MKHLKIALPMLFIILAYIFTACSVSNSTTNELENQNVTINEEQILENVENEANSPLNITTTLAPVYHWTKEIIGDQTYRFNVRLLQSSHSNIHTYYPDIDDLITLSDTDIFIYLGADYEFWASNQISRLEENGVTVIDLSKIYRSKKNSELELIASNENADLIDEHFWLSLKNAIFFVEEISNFLSRVDTKNAKIYNDNALLYQEDLSMLDRKYEFALESSKRDTVIIVDNFPFKYLFEEYNLRYISGKNVCNDDTYLSDSKINYLVEQVNLLEVPAIFTLSNTSNEYAEEVAERSNNPDLKIYTLDPIEDTSTLDNTISDTYILTMRENLKMLLKALND